MSDKELLIGIAEAGVMHADPGCTTERRSGTRATEVITWLAALFVVGYWTWRLVA